MMKEVKSAIPFEALFEHASVGIIISNAQGVMEQVNPHAAQLFGYEVNELVGEKVEILLPANFRDNHVGQRQNYNERPKNRTMGAGQDLIANRKDGSEFYVEISLSFYKYQDELQIVSFINDVSESKRYKQKLSLQAQELETTVVERTKELSNALTELHQVNENLESEIKTRKNIEMQVRAAFEKEKELNELKSRFVSMASHEFRTPLGGIMTSASLLQKYTSSEMQGKREKHINIIKSSVKNLTSILNDFLSLDKLEEGSYGANPSKFNLTETIEKIIKDVRNLESEDRDIIYEHCGKSEVLYQDIDMLRNIMINLISNAVKYSPAPKPIFVYTEVKGYYLELVIKDQGYGIPLSDQKNLFERFFRASNVTTIQGTGLGLTIVNKYLEFMNGDISFVSKENKGTTFTIRLPLELKK